MFNVVLYQPEIPPNTGNIIRLCANNGAQLHLIEPLGFSLSAKACRRAGLDYKTVQSIQVHADYDAFIAATHPKRLFACSTKGARNYSNVAYEAGDYFIFGPETRGLPSSILEDTTIDTVIRIPMFAHSRSLNLANAVAIITYEALRQCQFQQLD